MELVLEPDVRKGLAVFAQHDLGDVDEIQAIVFVTVVCDETVAGLVDFPLCKALGGGLAGEVMDADLRI
mgnify:CR=1 FL=1